MIQRCRNLAKAAGMKTENSQPFVNLYIFLSYKKETAPVGQGGFDR
jgi:hypothetical protein